MKCYQFLRHQVILCHLLQGDQKGVRGIDPGDEALISSLIEVTGYAREVKEKSAKERDANFYLGWKLLRGLTDWIPGSKPLSSYTYSKYFCVLNISYLMWTIPRRPPKVMHHNILHVHHVQHIIYWRARSPYQHVIANFQCLASSSNNTGKFGACVFNKRARERPSKSTSIF